MTPRLNKVFRFEIPAAEMMDLVVKAVQAVPAVIGEVDDKEGVVTAKTKQTIKSRGENLRIQIEPLDRDNCQVRIDSELMWILTELQHDWGVNEHNIEAFEKALQQGVRQWKKAHKAASPAPAPAESGLVQLRCAACGAKLTRQVTPGRWVCEYCGHEYFEKK